MSGYAICTARENRELRAAIGFAAKVEDERRGDTAAEKIFLAQRALDFGWENTSNHSQDGRLTRLFISERWRT